MKPVILITPDAIEQPDIRYIQRAYYTDATAKAGGLPLIVPPLNSKEEMLDILSIAQGIIFTGSPDIDPSLYGQERHEKTKLIHRRREKFEMDFIRLAYEKDISLLAVCGGFQLLCVSLGGTLVQHIPDHFKNAIQHFTVDGKKASHEVKIERESKLFNITGKESINTNSFHHQALLDVPEALKITAHSQDGVVEAYEDPNKKFCIGVQWHPERMTGDTYQESLFGEFIKASAPGK